MIGEPTHLLSSAVLGASKSPASLPWLWQNKITNGIGAKDDTPFQTTTNSLLSPLVCLTVELADKAPEMRRREPTTRLKGGKQSNIPPERRVRWVRCPPILPTAIFLASCLSG